MGTVMLFHCDYVLASNAATFSAPYIHLGLVPVGAASLLMPSTMGYQRAFAMLVMGRTFTAAEAHAAGFVNTVVSPGHTEVEARKVAREICRLPAEAVATSRKLLRAAAGGAHPPHRPGGPSVRRAAEVGRGDCRVQGVCKQEEEVAARLQHRAPARRTFVKSSRGTTNLVPCDTLPPRSLLPSRSPPSPPSAQTAAPVELRILAINDFHGNLRPPPGGIRISDPEDKSKKVMVAAGGAEYMATLVKQLREGHKNTIFVAAGDLIGASPFLSAMFHDEPSIESLSMMGLAITSVGNHEFDEGKTELLRMQNGGCHPVDGCQGPHPFTGAKFHYLAASTIETATGKSVLPPYEIREFEGIPVAFIGLTLKETAGIVSPSGVAGLEFRDEAETVNALVPQLKARGVEAIVVLIHQGGEPAGDYNECPAITGPIVDIVKKFDRAVDVVVSGHTHRAYVCDIDGRLVTSGDKYGTLVTAIDLKLDPATRDIVSAKAENVIVANASLAKDPEQTALIEAYDKLSAPIANRPAGSVTQTLSRVPNEAGESALGDVIADAQLAATQGRQGWRRCHRASPIPAASAPTSFRRRTARCPSPNCSRASRSATASLR